jgi:hypothetical protein
VNGGPRGERVYAALIRLYPRRFREDYGADLVQLLREQCAEEPAWRVYGRALVDLAITVPSQRLEALVHNNSTRVVSLLYAAVATAGALLAIVGGSNTVTLTVGLLIALAAGAMAVTAYRRGARRATAPTAAWWTFILAGLCLIGAVIIAAGAGVDAWYVGMLAVLLGAVLSVTGAVLGVARLVRRRPGAVPT